MPLVGHDSPVVDNPHDESKSNLLGPHGSESHHAFASAKNASRFEQWQGVESTRQNCEPDISSYKSHTSDENIIQTESCGRHRTHFNHQRRQRYSEPISVSYVVSRFPRRSCQPRLIFSLEAIHSLGYNSNPFRIVLASTKSQSEHSPPPYSTFFQSLVHQKCSSSTIHNPKLVLELFRVVAIDKIFCLLESQQSIYTCIQRHTTT
jgi:hypothetical protein